MATSNQLAHEANKIQAAANEERKRSNLKQESLKERELSETERTGKATRYEKYASGTGKALTGVANMRRADQNSVNSKLDALSKGIGTGLDIIALANDPSWYERNPAAIKAAASVSTLIPLGAESDIGSATNGEVLNSVTLTGLARFTYFPVLPHSKAGSADGGAVDPEFDRAFQNLYMETRRANSGSRNYERTNQAQFVMATNGMISLWMEGYRAFNAMQTIKTMNRYTGEHLLTALKWDYSSLDDNLAEFASFLNRTGKIISKNFPVPQNMPWFYRSIWAASNIYSDIEDAEHARYYFAVPAAYCKYGDVEFFSDYEIRAKWEVDGLMTVPNFRKLMNLLINTLLYSEDAGVIAGDLIKAFGEGTIQKFPSIDIDSPPELFIKANDLVRAQFNNAVIVPVAMTVEDKHLLNALRITEVVGEGLFQPLTFISTDDAGHAYGAYGDKVNRYSLTGNNHKSDMTPGEQAEVIMLKALYKLDNTDEDTYVTVSSCATEIVTDVALIDLQNDEIHEWSVPPVLYVNAVGTTSGNKLSDYVLNHAKLSQFHDVIPNTRIYIGLGEENFSTAVVFNHALTWPFTISDQVYENIKTVSVESLLGL